MCFVVFPGFLFYMSNGTILGAVDTRPVIPTSVSLVREGDWDLSEFDRRGQAAILHDRKGDLLKCYQTQGHGIYSAFPSGMVMFAAPVTALARFCRADLQQAVVHLRLEKITASMVAALSLGLFFVTACCLGSAEAAAVTTLLLSVSSAIFTTVSMGLWQHGGIVFWLLAVLVVEFSSAGRPSAWGTVVQGVACAALLMCRPTAALLVVSFGTWILLRSWKRAFRVAAVAAVAYLPCILMYYFVYGNIFGPATINGNMSGSYWKFGRIETLVGVLACPARGLFVYQPWLILAAMTCFLASGHVKDSGLPGGPRRVDGFLSHRQRGPLLSDLVLARLVGRLLLGVASPDRHLAPYGTDVRSIDHSPLAIPQISFPGPGIRGPWSPDSPPRRLPECCRLEPCHRPFERPVVVGRRTVSLLAMIRMVVSEALS